MPDLATSKNCDSCSLSGLNCIRLFLSDRLSDLYVSTRTTSRNIFSLYILKIDKLAGIILERSVDVQVGRIVGGRWERGHLPIVHLESPLPEPVARRTTATILFSLFGSFNPSTFQPLLTFVHQFPG